MLGFRERSTSTITPGLVSDAFFAFDTQHAPLWERETGYLIARSGHRGAFNRASTLTVTGVSNGSYVVPSTVPAFEQKTLIGTSRLVLTMDTGDSLAFNSVQIIPQAMSGWLRIVETGNRTVANGTVFAIADNADSGVRLYIDTSGTYYRMTYHNGTTAVTATLTSGQPTAGQTVDFGWNWAANGALTFTQSINGAAPTTATSSAQALPAASAMPSYVCLNMRGPTGTAVNRGKASYRSCVMAPGTLTVAQLQGLW